jgi:hypothetical protein
MIYTAHDGNAFDAGKWEGVGPWKSRLLWGLVKWHRAGRRGPFGAQKVYFTVLTPDGKN